MKLKKVCECMKKKTVYYQDKANDDFFNFSKKYDKIKFDANYNYVEKGKIKKVVSFCLYYFVAWPVLSFFMYIIQCVKIVGRKNVKTLKDKGYMIVGNHTHYKDAYISQIGITAPKRTYIIANNNAVQLPIIGRIARYLGAIAVPQTISGFKKFYSEIEKLLANKNVIVVYPDAHIWPYYTGLRDFPLSSFSMAAKNKVPVVPIATTYKKRLLFKSPKAIVFVGKPIFFDKNLTERQNAMYYRNMSFNFIKEKVFNKDNYTYINYSDNALKEREVIFDDSK